MKKGDKIYINVSEDSEKIAYSQKEIDSHLKEANLCEDDIIWEATLVKKFVVKDNHQQMVESKK